LRNHAEDLDSSGDAHGAALQRRVADLAERLAGTVERYLEALDQELAGAGDRSVTEQRYNKTLEALNEWYEAAKAAEDYFDSRTPDEIPNPVAPGDEPIQDPRCEGRRIDAERGALFSNPDLCPDQAYLRCLRERSDVLYAVTEERCFRDTGPNDAPIIVCEEPDSPTVSADNTPNNETDVGDFTDPNAPLNSSGEIETSYISTTDFGALILRLCGGGGCPDNP
jgi:hypothetical protein